MMMMKIQAASILTLIAVATAAFIFWPRGPGGAFSIPDTPVAFQQFDAAEDSGVEIRLREVVFSGVETVVVMDVLSDDLGPSAINGVSVFEEFLEIEGFDPSTSHTFSGEGGPPAVLRLPPVDPEADNVSITIHRVTMLVGPSLNPQSVDGTWRLEILLPNRDSLEDLQRVEVVGPVDVGLGDGTTAPVTIEQSRSRLVASFALPREYLLLRPPEIRLATGQILEGAVEPTGRDGSMNAYEAYFPPAPLGAELEFRFTDMVMQAASEGGSVELPLAAEGILPGESGSQGVVDLSGTQGGGIVVESIEFGASDSQPEGDLTRWVRITVAGPWHLELLSAPVQILDAAGQMLRLRSAGVSYATNRDDEGALVATSEFEASYDVSNDLTALTLELGGEQQTVAPSGWVRLESES